MALPPQYSVAEHTTAAEAISISVHDIYGGRA